MAVFRKLFSDPLQVRRKNNLKRKKHSEDKKIVWKWWKGRLSPYLYRVQRARGEGCVWKGLSGTQQIADAIEIMLVLLDGLNPQPVPRQHCFIAWSIAGWWEEFKIPVTASQKKPKPCEIRRKEKKKKRTCVITLLHNQKIRIKKKKYHSNRISHVTPAEKLTTGKKRPSKLKFSNMPWTGWPLIRKEILGTLRSKQQLTTSSAVRICWLGEATWRGTRPVDI